MERMRCDCLSLPGLLGLMWFLDLVEVGIVLLDQVGECLAIRAFAGRHFAPDIDPTPEIGNFPELAFRSCPFAIGAGYAPFQRRSFSEL